MNWQMYAQASCLPDCWCEAPRWGSWVLEPSNTASNVFYFVVAFLVMLPWVPAVAQTVSFIDRRYVRTFAVAMAATGVGSTLFHASLTFVAQWMDHLGMILVMLFFIFFHLMERTGGSYRRFMGLYVPSVLLLSTATWYFPEVRRYLFGAEVALVLGITLLQVKRRPASSFWGLTAFGVFALGQFAWILDHKKIVCNPYGWLTGHAIWHLAAASACLCYFIYLYIPNFTFRPSYRSAKV